MGLLKVLLLGVSLAIFFLDCEKDQTALSSLSVYQWEVSSPENQGMDGGLLNQVYIEAQQTGFIYSILIVKNGYLIGERYFQGYSRFHPCNVMSVSKSFLSALVGLALHNGYLESLDQKMVDFFPEYSSAGLDPDIENITIRHLLQMRAGFDPSIEDYETNFSNWISSSDWIQFILQWPLRDEPGMSFAYITAESHLLSAILTKSTGMSSLEFARQFLFTPLKISIYGWDRDPGGYYTGGMGMYFTPRDMARYGFLILHNGGVDGEQIVPETWIRESLQRYSTGTTAWGDLTDIGYGYQWWLGRLGGRGCYMALGYGGQYILIFPSLEMIVVVTSDHRFDKYTADEHERAVLSLCNNYVLAATRALLKNDNSILNRK